MCARLETRTASRRPSLWTLVRADRGAQLVEAAVVLTLLLTLVIGIIWLARGYNTAQTVTRAAREGARFAVVPTCATCGNAYPTETEVRTVVDQTLVASSLDPSFVTGFTLQRGIVLNPGSTPTETGAAVTFNYPFQFVLPFTSTHLTTITLTANVRMREE